MCFESDGGYTVVDVWDSAEEFEAFGEVMARVMEEAPAADGGNRAGPIQISIHAVHNSIP